MTPLKLNSFIAPVLRKQTSLSIVTVDCIDDINSSRTISVTVRVQMPASNIHTIYEYLRQLHSGLVNQLLWQSVPYPLQCILQPSNGTSERNSDLQPSHPLLNLYRCLLMCVGRGLVHVASSPQSRLPGLTHQMMMMMTMMITAVMMLNHTVNAADSHHRNNLGIYWFCFQFTFASCTSVLSYSSPLLSFFLVDC